MTQFSPVAQLVEQVAVNHPVAGSSPARGANFFPSSLFFAVSQYESIF